MTTAHKNNRPVAFTGKPTKSQFARYLSANPLVDHPLFAEYSAARGKTHQGNDDFGGWLAKKYQGSFMVRYSKCLGDPSTWEKVWSA